MVKNQADETKAPRGPPRPLSAERVVRATRRQRFDYDEASASLSDLALNERLTEAGKDRRGGWRQTKAKGNRRNRRYQNRLLDGLDGREDYVDFDEL